MCSQHFARVNDQAGVCETAAKLIAETLDVTYVLGTRAQSGGVRFVGRRGFRRWVLEVR
jgi:hypothetical protein